MKSPLAPKTIPDLPDISGIDMISGAAGLRYQGRDDLWIFRAQPGAAIAGVFTKNKIPGAPIDWSKRALTIDRGPSDPIILVVNAGNANVFTGKLGLSACQTVAQSAGKAFGCNPQSVLQASTGVIGQPLDGDEIARHITKWAPNTGQTGWNSAAEAILTTDTYPKCVHRTAKIGDIEVQINGVAKGSGMIAPDMATMLGFIGTDANIPQTILQSLLSEAVNISFNAITVDSDQSTSDMVLLIASGAAGNDPIENADALILAEFKDALIDLCKELSHLIIKDGEGAQKFVTVNVNGAIDNQSAKNVAMAIANSPLVKTAIAGEDANWGRIAMAVGKAGEPADRDLLSIAIGPHKIAVNGQLHPNYTEKDGAAYMKNQNIEIHVDLGLGNGHFTAWSCDLTHRYIDINADYRS